MTVPFADYVALLDALLDRRAQVVEAIERQTLNVQHKETARRRDRAYFEQLFDRAIFSAPGLRDLSSLPAALAATHTNDGFRLRLHDRQLQRLNPLELLVRAYQHWEMTRWPGRNGRLSFGQLLFSVFLFGQLELLSLRIWDDGDARADRNLAEVQRLLDRLNTGAPPRFVRDARWLIQTAQGALTTELAPYFTVAARVAHALGPANQLEVHRAGAVLAGGHLRSQQRYRALEAGLPADDPHVLAITRNSNAMDVALLVGDLLPLLGAYQIAVDAGDAEQRLRLADAILQGLSADPDLLLTRRDLLGPATAIEDVFLSEGRAEHTPAGVRHASVLVGYAESIERLREPLAADALSFEPAGRPYASLGITYGFCADLLWNDAVRALLFSQPSPDLTLEDLFESRQRLDEKAAAARNRERLPHGGDDHEPFTHSEGWASEVFHHILARLEQRTSGESRPAGRLFVLPEGTDPAAASLDGIAAQEHLVTSDVQRALAGNSTAFPKSHLLSDRKEGRYLASVERDGKWFAISKAVLTTHLARGENAIIADVPAALIDRLRLTVPDLLEVATAAADIAS